MQEFFRSDPEVQLERVERRRQAAEELKKALIGPDSLHRNLAEKGLVGIEGVRGPHSYRNISLVKITAKGIDYHDGRLPQDEGIYLEPRQ